MWEDQIVKEIRQADDEVEIKLSSLSFINLFQWDLLKTLFYKYLLITGKEKPIFNKSH